MKKEADTVITLFYIGIYYSPEKVGPSRTYKIVTNSYLAHGGDGYTMFLSRYDSSRFQRDVLIDYIRYLGSSI